jgi:uncharacterized protein YbaR (Trm112 family)
VEGERKQVTVLFADLKGSMELLADRDTSKSAPRHWAWAALMRRAFDLDVLACPRCRGRLRLIATVEDPEAIRAILAARAGSRTVVGGRRRVRPGSLPVPRWCSAPERHRDAAVAEVCSLASWAGASLWTGALFWQKMP